MGILELFERFPSEQICIDYLEQLRWNGNVVSPFDKNSKVYKCAGNKYRCRNTGKYFNVRTATLFDSSKVEFKKWFLAIYLVTSRKRGISSIQLGKLIGVTQKTAWFMLQTIKKEITLIYDNKVYDFYIYLPNYFNSLSNYKEEIKKEKKIKNKITFSELKELIKRLKIKTKQEYYEYRQNN